MVNNISKETMTEGPRRGRRQHGSPYPVHKKRAHYKAGVCLALVLGLMAVHGLRRCLVGGEDSLEPPRQPRASLVRKLLHVAGERFTAVGDDEGGCDDDTDCRDIHRINGTQARCDFVMATCDCGTDEGLIEYNQWVYCRMGNLIPLAMIILFIWLVFVFVALAVTADDYFCPSLVVISKVLHLSPNVANGVTFLAFGNGAPDLFSAIAALEGGGDPALGVGGLLGAGVFVTTVVVGVIALIKPFKAMERPFLRDALFYVVGVYWLFFILWKGKMLLGEAIGFLVFWVFYVFVVVISGTVYSKQAKAREAKKARLKPAGAANGSDVLNVNLPKIDTTLSIDNIYANNNKGGMQRSDTSLSFEAALEAGNDNPAFQLNETINEEDEPPPLSSVKGDTEKSSVQGVSYKTIDLSILPGEDTKPPMFRLHSESDDASGINSMDTGTTNLESATSTINNSAMNEEKKNDEEPDEPVDYWKKLGFGLVPINLEEWPDMPRHLRALEVFKCPFVLVINLTCPVVNYEEEQNGWNRLLHCVQFFVAPTLCTLLIQHGLSTIGGVFPVYGLTLILGLAAALVIFFTTKNEEPPRGHDAFGFLGFLIALVWIYVVANELVSLLETFGLVINISEAILGLTLLAWGNSVGDAISNSLMARQGFARMGFAACFGGPFFRFGIPMLVAMGRSKVNERKIVMTGVQLILTSTILFTVLSTIIIMMATKFKVSKALGIYLLVLYGVFLAVAIMSETNVFLRDWKPS